MLSAHLSYHLIEAQEPVADLSICLTNGLSTRVRITGTARLRRRLPAEQVPPCGVGGLTTNQVVVVYLPELHPLQLGAIGTKSTLKTEPEA